MNWSQLQTIFWLRWRLSANQFARGGTFNSVMSVVATVGAVLISVTGLAVGLWAGAAGLAAAPAEIILIIWDVITCAFLFFWALGIVTEFQRSETIDLRRLLYLPASLKGVFFINYLASHLTLSLIVCLPGMLGLAVGLVVGRGPIMLWLLPAIFSVIFMVTAWTYCLRGWLIALMVNPRRRRVVIMSITMAFVLVAQLPNFVNLYYQRNRLANGAQRPAATRASNGPAGAPSKIPIPAAWLSAHRYAPPLWLAGGALALAQGRPAPAALGTAGALLLGALGLRRAYRSTVRFYEGADEGKRPTAPLEKPAARGGWRLIEAEAPGVPEEAAAVAVASLRSMLRAPEVMMTVVSSFIVLLIFGVMMFVRTFAPISAAGRPFVTTGVAVAVSFGLGQLIMNQFGMDRDGFRALALSPIARRNIILGRNMAFLPIVFTLGGAYLALLAVVGKPPPGALLGAAIQLPAMFLLACMMGNLASIFAPFRVAAGSLKPTKASSKIVITLIAFQILFILAQAPLFLPAWTEWWCRKRGWFSGVPINPALSLILAFAIALLYRASLGPFGRLLQRRESRILETVTREVE